MYGWFSFTQMWREMGRIVGDEIREKAFASLSSWKGVVRSLTGDVQKVSKIMRKRKIHSRMFRDWIRARAACTKSMGRFPGSATISLVHAFCPRNSDRAFLIFSWVSQWKCRLLFWSWGHTLFPNLTQRLLGHFYLHHLQVWGERGER